MRQAMLPTLASLLGPINNWTLKAEVQMMSNRFTNNMVRIAISKSINKTLLAISPRAVPL